jgi:hypothetical protein
MYGPTETTVWSTYCQVTNPGDVHIGRPIDNTEIYILDENHRPLPVCVAGELLIGGAGLARGYHNRPDLNAEKFIANPFKPGQRLYRTGDLARWRADGNIDCLGRLDHQVKVRGYRIELEEVQSALLKHPSVGNAAVVARPDSTGENQLIAYLAMARIAPDSDCIDELRGFLRQRLPPYMLPAAYVFLPALPLTPNGKIDRRALPNPVFRPPEGPVTSEPEGELEVRLAKIWEKVLKVEKVRATDNFFELGGHSLLAAQLFAQIEKELEARLPLAVLFQSPTLRGIAEEIRRAGSKSSWNCLVPLRTEGTRPPLFLVHGAEGNVLLYNRLRQELGNDQPLYGLQASGLDGSKPMQTTLESMASNYLAEIKSVQPEGPYFLGGYCLGGTIALEIAQQMRRAGEKVALLAMIETYNIRAEPCVSSWLNLLHKAQNLYFQFRNLLLSLSSGSSRYFTERCQIELGRLRVRQEILRSKILNRIRPGSGLKYQHLEIKHVNDSAQASYSPKPYDGRIALFRPRSDYFRFNDCCYGWREIAVRGVEIAEMPNYPHGSLNDPFVTELAQRLASMMDKAILEAQSSAADNLAPADDVRTANRSEHGRATIRAYGMEPHAGKSL